MCKSVQWNGVPIRGEPVQVRLPRPSSSYNSSSGPESVRPPVSHGGGPPFGSERDSFHLGGGLASSAPFLTDPFAIPNPFSSDSFKSENPLRPSLSASDPSSASQFGGEFGNPFGFSSFLSPATNYLEGESANDTRGSFLSSAEPTGGLSFLRFPPS